MQRRDFLRGLAVTTASVLVVPRLAYAQQVRTASPDSAMNMGASNGPMNEGRYKPVRLPAKSGSPVLTTADRDAVEHRLHCQCGCNLDVYTCRTTDFSCSVSPSMHGDVNGLVAGGYDAQQIVNAFVGVYGEQVLMEPRREGFNLLGFTMPFAALAGGAALTVALLRRWQARAAAHPVPPPDLPTDATPDELTRLQALVRHDDR